MDKEFMKRVIKEREQIEALYEIVDDHATGKAQRRTFNRKLKESMQPLKSVRRPKRRGYTAKKWTFQDEQTLLKLVEMDQPKANIAVQMGRSQSSIYNRLQIIRKRKPAKKWKL